MSPTLPVATPEPRVEALSSALAAGVVERGSFGESPYPPETYRGLQWIRAASDPGELLRASHPIGRAAGPA